VQHQSDSGDQHRYRHYFGVLQFRRMIGLPLLFAEAVFPRRSGCLRLSGNTRRYELTNVLAHLFGG
jgi:hypothetical protein